MVMKDTRVPLSAAVLAGGKSRRMGTDKALLSLMDGGPPLMAMVLERLAAVADDVMAVANDGERYARFGVPVVADLLAGAGTLAGIHAAIAHAKHDHCLVVACDLPFLSNALLRRMASETRDYDVLVPRLPGESRQGGGLVYQTLHAIYGKACLPAIESRVEQGQLQVIRFFPDVRVRALGLAEVASFDPDLLSFFNANSPEALAAATRLATSGNADRT
jgi:molybdopterin-guanine dinucleotide biosynthesis protein A